MCKTAGVNRSTFYLHYETLGDLLNETTQYLLSTFLSYFNDELKNVAYDISACELEKLVFVYDEYMHPYLTYIKENKEVFSTALSSLKFLGFEDVYKRLFEHIFNPILDRFEYPEEDRKYVMMYYLNGINAIVLEWLKDDCKKPIEDVSHIITICIFGKN